MDWLICMAAATLMTVTEMICYKLTLFSQFFEVFSYINIMF